MPKVKFQAGMELDVLNKDELDSSLNDSIHKFAKLLSSGVGFGKYVFGAFNASAGVPVFLNGMGPRPGYIWSVRNVTYSNFPASPNYVDITLNGSSFSDTIVAGLSGRGTQTFGSNSFIIPSGNDLWLNPNATVTNGIIVFYYEEVLLEDVGKL